MSSLIRRSTTAVLGTVFVSILVGAGIASAHIDPDPVAIQAGSAATVGFGVEHGCNGSNTTTVAIKIPDGITDAKAVDKAGWTATTAGGTVTFADGNLDAATAESFQISFTAPTTAGTINFPIVQTCAVGETAWIELPAADGTEPEHPAPAVLVTAGVPTSDDLQPAHDGGATADSTVVTTGSTDTSTGSSSGITVVATAPATGSTSGSSDDSSNTGLIVGVAIGAVVVIGGAVAIAKKRRA